MEAEAPPRATAAVQQGGADGGPMRPQTTPRRETPVAGRADAPCRAEPVCAAAHRRAGRRHRPREPAPRPRAGHLLPDAAGACAGAGRVAPGRPVGDGRALTNTSGRWISTSTRAPCRGNFVAATFQHPTWGRPGPSDTTVLYPGHARPRPGRVAAAGAQPIDATVNLPPRWRPAGIDRRSAR